MKKIAISQSNYIPWKGYFDLIASVDEFILYDDMQYTKRDWRNRNVIKTHTGVKWLTIPVATKGKFSQSIRETLIVGKDWASLHWKNIESNYKKAAHYDAVATWLRPAYLELQLMGLSEINRIFINEICDYLAIKTQIKNSWDYLIDGDKSEWLANLCHQAGGTCYLSGPAARNYLDIEAFAKKGIQVEWFNYQNYPVYPQLWGPFVHEVSIVDLLLNCGETSREYMKKRSE